MRCDPLRPWTRGSGEVPVWPSGGTAGRCGGSGGPVKAEFLAGPNGTWQSGVAGSEGRSGQAEPETGKRRSRTRRFPERVSGLAPAGAGRPVWRGASEERAPSSKVPISSSFQGKSTSMKRTSRRWSLPQLALPFTYGSEFVTRPKTLTRMLRRCVTVASLQNHSRRRHRKTFSSCNNQINGPGFFSFAAVF